ncbi:MAG: hypothetical protein QOG62_435 [Thermoleophilaceae bacterium]|nr:hypothetical protein [Thermoleophilaceae bacterium]
MPSNALYDALRIACLDTAAVLTRAVKMGDELRFDLVEERGRGAASLYHYRPRTAEFISAHWDDIRALESFEAATRALDPAAPAYIQVRALAGSGGEIVFRDLVDRIYDEASDFGFPEQRFELICSEVGQTLGETVVRAVVIGRIHGVHLASPTVGLDDQLALAGGRAVTALPPGLMEDEDGLVPPEVVCVFAVEQDGAEPLPVEAARARFRRLLTGLRLMGAAGARIDSLGWTRAGDGPWRPAALDAGVSARREEWRLAEDDEPELCDLLDVLGTSRRFGRLNWALARFEMGCSRSLATEALSDHLLAVRALLGGMRRDDSRLGMRLAALCAEAEEHDEVRRLVDDALDLEPTVIDGYTGRGESGHSALEVVGELEHHLRALLRDLLCGYLDEDLVSCADELLLAGGAEGEIEAHDIRVPDEPAVGAQIDLEHEIERRVQISALETQEFNAISVDEAPDEDDVVYVEPAADADFDEHPEPEPEPAWEYDEPEDEADYYAGPV